MSESGRPGVQGVLAMLLACVIVFAVALWALGMVTVQFGAHPPARPAGSESPLAVPEPSLEKGDEHVEQAVGMLGYSQVHVYRWHDGALNGWVQLLTSKGPQKKEIFDPKSFFAKDQAYDPSAVSGAIVIALKEPTKEKPAVQECLVSWHVQVRQPNKLIVGIPGSFTGTVPARDIAKGIKRDLQNVWPKSGADCWFTADGKEYQWYQLKLSER